MLKLSPFYQVCVPHDEFDAYKDRCFSRVTAWGCEWYFQLPDIAITPEDWRAAVAGYFQEPAAKIETFKNETGQYCAIIK